MSYRPDHRDPLVQRFRRSVLETIADPHAYSEGPAEPQFVETPRDPPGAFERVLDVFNGRPWLTLAVCSAAVAGWYWLTGAA
jgi:hypothetical protein